jgi:hypothetical protein
MHSCEIIEANANQRPTLLATTPLDRLPKPARSHGENCGPPIDELVESHPNRLCLARATAAPTLPGAPLMPVYRGLTCWNGVRRNLWTTTGLWKTTGVDGTKLPSTRRWERPVAAWETKNAGDTKGCHPRFVA